MFTGLYPFEHGSRVNGVPLSRDRTTIAEFLNSHGFRTGAFVSGYTLRADISGLDQGFETYDGDFQGRRRDGAITVSNAIDWLGDGDPGQRFFLWVHLFDAHGPYRPHDHSDMIFHSKNPGPIVRIPRYQRLDGWRGVATRHLNGFVDRYDDQIHYVDSQLGRLLRKLDMNDTIVVVLADHGETLGERFHALDHGSQLFDEQTRIPLVIAVPGARPTRVDIAVETVDLYPTILKLLGFSSRTVARLPGRDLSPLFHGASVKLDRYTHSCARAVSKRHRDHYPELDEDRQIFCIRTLKWKLIDYPVPDGDAYELYDLESDPGEKTNVYSAQPDIAHNLVAALHHWNPDLHRRVEQPKIPLYERKNLWSLGYLGQ